MKALVLLTFVSTLAFSQAPAPAKPPAAKAPAAKKTVAKSSSARLLTPAALRARAPETFKATFTTTKGDFVLEVHRDWAPLGADRFFNLVRNGFFTNVSFYRVLAGSLVQFGASPDPKVAAAWSRAPISDDPVKQSNTRGRVSFAMSGPNTRTTQVFINLKNNAGYDAMGFAPFGEVVEGMEIVDSFYSGYGDMPDLGGQGPSQQRVSREGKAYLDKSFPNLDSIVSATITSAEPPAVAAPKPSAPKRTAPAVKKASPAKPTTEPK
jgi:peptidyl-prolyl cis-trans isomerase A (cyclophilin A)